MIKVQHILYVSLLLSPYMSFFTATNFCYFWQFHSNLCLSETAKSNKNKKPADINIAAFQTKLMIIR